MSNYLSILRPPPGSRKRPKRVGRGIGSGHGRTACRGTKGQKSSCLLYTSPSPRDS